MAKNPSLTQDKLDILAQIPESVIEQLSAGVKTQADLHELYKNICNRERRKHLFVDCHLVKS